MSNILEQAVEDKLKDLGADGIAKIQELLNLKAGEVTGWQKSVYTLVSSSVATYGPAGINKALEALHGLENGHAVNMDWADLEASSDILARMQNEEADARTATRAFLVQVGEVVKEIVGVTLALV